jgi:hypothetical protein
LKASGLVDVTLTCGQAFGGDRETVNIYTPLMAASDADVILVAPGPGHVGTSTRFGFSGIELADVAAAVEVLGGDPILIPRISFADPRERHQGVSHHTITLLARTCRTRTTVVLPRLPERETRVVNSALGAKGTSERHNLIVEDGAPALSYLRERRLEMRSMGRTADEDPAFFLAAGAAGVYAGSEWRRANSEGEGGQPCDCQRKSPS